MPPCRVSNNEVKRWIETTGVEVSASVRSRSMFLDGYIRVRTTNWETEAATASTRLQGWSVTPEGEIVRPSGPAGELVDEINATGEAR